MLGAMFAVCSGKPAFLLRWCPLEAVDSMIHFSQPKDHMSHIPTLQSAFVAALAARMLAKAERFNKEIIGTPIPAVPAVLPPDRYQFATKCFAEELGEFGKAVAEDDVVEAADALIDLIYFAFGRLVEMGVPAAAVMDSVHKANMGKERGEMSKRPGANGYDAVKPEGWRAPDHMWLLGFTMEDLAKARAYDELSPVWKEIHELRIRKGSDYDNVPGGKAAYFPFGHLSYAHMVMTKALRMQSLLQAMLQGKSINFEGLDDTMRDLVNYATYYAEAMADGRLEEGALLTAPPTTLPYTPPAEAPEEGDWL